MANSKKKSSKKKSDGSGQEAPRGFPIANDWKGDVQDFDPRATPGFSGKKADGKEVLNRDLLESLDAALTGREVEFEWVKGHSNHAMNEAADDRARAAATAFQKGTPVPEGPGYVPAGTPVSVGAAPAEATAESATTVVSTRVPARIADALVSRARARGIHPQEYLAELIGRSLESE